MTGREPTAGLLDGIRVLDLATERAELAGRVLADLGAEVIKVEPPQGAAARHLPPFVAGHETDPEHSLYWASVALGKKSIVLDVTEPADRARIADLAAGADIFIESFDPGVVGELGLGYEILGARNPRLIYVSVTPYGQDGPQALRPATELTIEAAGGLVGMQGDGDRPPVPVGYPQSAFHAGVQAAADAIIALNERDRSGLGQRLDVSMQAAMVWTLMNATGYPANTGGDPPTSAENRVNGRLEIAPGVVFPNIWACKDGWVQGSFTLGGLGARTLGNLINLIEAEGELSRELAASGWTAWTRSIAPGAVDPEILVTAKDEIARYFLARTQEELMRRAVDHKLLVAPIRTVEALLESPQLRARGYWQEVDGRIHPGSPVVLSRTPMQIGPAPKLGEHQHLVSEGVPPRPAAATISGGAPRARAFEGLKVADFAWVGVGPIVAKALADHGATVVHVESATRPDVLRLGPPFKDGQPGLDRSQFFANFNSSKLGLAVNLAMPEGHELAQKLIDWADVVVESFTPGVIEGLGFSYEELSAKRPDLVMLSTCLCGQSGPDATYRGFGTQGACLAGLHGLTGWPDRPPAGTWGAYTDFIAPRYGIAALGAAIRERNRTGLGQHVDLGQVEAGIHFLEPLVLDYTVNGRTRRAAGHESELASPHGVYRTAGIERYVALAAETIEHWDSLCGVIALEAIAPRHASLAERLAVDAQLDAVISEWCASRGPFEAVEELTAAGVPAAVVQRPTDLHRDPQLAHRRFFVVCDHGVMGQTPYDGPVTIFSETPPALRAAPCLGEDTFHVLSEILGLSEEEIAEYAASGVLA
jgi:crotonobetainyl-CoA:carnitine CoA-transferase CaiB-like acyl-CoA transferase